MLFIWFNKLVLIPIEIVLVGNKMVIFEGNSPYIYTEIGIILTSFIGFVVGWQSNRLQISSYQVGIANANQRNPNRLQIGSYQFGIANTDQRKNADQRKQKFNLSTSLYFLVFVFLLVGFLSIISFHGSLQNYLTDAWLTPKTRFNLERLSGTSTGYLTNIGQRFLPFGVVLSWIIYKSKFRNNQIINILFLILCFFSTLSSNRSNIIYPLLAFAALIWPKWKMKNKFWLLVAALVSLFLIFFYGSVRSQSELDTQQVNSLFETYIDDMDYVWYAHQIYFGSPYQITPLLNSNTQHHFTLLASVLDPIPILGKAFREQSGPFLYNLIIYDSPDVQDKVIPVAGELFFNGGYTLVFMAHLLIGRAYSKLDLMFKQNSIVNLPLTFSVFYFTLLFNAFLMLSITVFIQFMVFNAAPIFCIWLFIKIKF